MPSIEIVCIDQEEPILFWKLPFQVFAESSLISHRTPSLLFKSDFKIIKGCIYHLCNFDGSYTAYTLLNKETVNEFWTIIQFLPEIVPAVQHVLAALIAASPLREILFTSDYQFGPDEFREQKPISLEEFWHRHDHEKIGMNSLYKTKG
ncbi:hypothetical protein B1R32_102174 [Abditibacterium utsteinense]|uniref:Uncharacterized protein n=1 Tax=Abditibacterium utsteinense TaxID=1960156 RepID=A0A2S8SWI0_9BACT|nr:hypothetical protein [Abditibacterium utsteinense]PQV65166.1 hypothetical protein B1R32_102174 [Abditibacterium utsteinense]